MQNVPHPTPTDASSSTQKNDTIIIAGNYIIFIGRSAVASLNKQPQREQEERREGGGSTREFAEEAPLSRGGWVEANAEGEEGRGTEHMSVAAVAVAATSKAGTEQPTIAADSEPCDTDNDSSSDRWADQLSHRGPNERSQHIAKRAKLGYETHRRHIYDNMS